MEIIFYFLVLITLWTHGARLSDICSILEDIRRKTNENI